MRWQTIAVLALSCALQLGAVARPTPIIAIETAGAWEKIYGPLFALYDDGTVIVRKNWRAGRDAGPSATSYVTLLVPNADAFARELFPYNPTALKPSYELSSATDQDQTSVWVRGHATRIYGEWDMPTRWADLPSESLLRERAMQERLPSGLRRLFGKIEELSRSPHSIPWTPKFCDVHFIDYHYAPEATTAWPDRWPIEGFHPAKDRFFDLSVRFPGSDLEDLFAFLSKLPERGAIGIGSYKVAVGAIFIRFPADTTWKRDLRNSQIAEERRQSLSLYWPKMTPKFLRDLRRLRGA